MADFSAASNNHPLVVREEQVGTAELLFRAAQLMNLAPEWITPNMVFAVTFKGREHYINHARSHLNSAISVNLSANKYLARRVFERHGIENIPYMVTSSLEQAMAFLQTHTRIVAKPISGSGSRDIHIITSLEQLTSLQLSKYIFEKYVQGSEFRYLVLDGNVLAVHQSEYGTSVESDRSLERISQLEDTWNPALVAVSLQVARALGLHFAAVDFMIDDEGHAYVLEANSMPGLKWFHAPSRGPAVDVAGYFMKSLFADSTY